MEEAGSDAGPGHVLNPNGRYAHSLGYVQRSLVSAGFDVLHSGPAVLRTEGGKPVNGLIVVARAV